MRLHSHFRGEVLDFDWRVGGVEILEIKGNDPSFLRSFQVVEGPVQVSKVAYEELGVEDLEIFAGERQL